ncbi:LuxR C-terminal-related transcriptional regulator [Streptomyces sp. NPDC057257]|uniref:helix-turn-helix transcriptional regulator n=1 Tax=Streptomyces sp. NPDC057257 TaxID=3346071 RepID=UPI00363E3A93
MTSVSGCPRLVGRDAELAAIRATVSALDQGLGGCVLLVGEHGVGRTALVAELAHDSDRTFVRLPPPTAGAGHDGPVGAAHDRSMGTTHDDGPLRDALRLEGLLDAGEAVLRALRSVDPDGGGVVCLVDDLHEFDEKSRAALLAAARRCAAVPVVFVLTAASDSDVARRELGVPVLRVPALSPDQTRELLDDRGEAPVTSQARAAIEAFAGGLPRYLVEVPDALEADQLSGHRSLPPVLPPGTTALAVGAPRLADLPATTRTLLLLAAVEGSGSMGTLVRCADVMGIELETLAAAERAGLIRIEGNRILFTPPQFASVVHHLAAGRERRQAYAAVADTLTSPEDADRRAWYRSWSVQGPDDRVAAALEETADAAGTRGGPAAKAAALERAADLTTRGAERGRRLVLAATEFWRAGDHRRAEAMLHGSRSLLDDPESRAAAAFLEGALELGRGDPGRAFAALARGARSAAGRDRELALDLAARAVGISWWSGRPDLVAVAAALVPGPAAPDDVYDEFVREAVSVGTDLFSDRFGRSEARAVRQRQLAGHLSEPRQMIFAAEAAGLIGDDVTALWMQDRATVRLRETNALAELPFALELMAHIHAWQGRPTAAEAAAREGLLVAGEVGDAQDRGFQLGLSAHIAALRGDGEGGRAAAARALELDDGPSGATVRWAVGRLALSEGRPQEALDHFLPILRGTRAHPVVRLFAAPDVVEAAVGVGDLATAQEALRRYLAWAQGGALWAKAVEPRLRALLTADKAVADGLFAQAVELVDATVRPFEAARARLLFGSHLRRQRRRLEAREHLRSALAGFESLGTGAWAARAREELRASGEAVQDPGRRELPVLTAQEAQVAHMVGAGASNREVARILQLSPRTVEYHLSKVYVKLGISTRAQLAQAEFAEAEAEADG